MKIFIKAAALLFVLLMSYSYSYAQKENNFILQGSIDGLKNGTFIYLLTPREGNKFDTLSISKAFDSKFTIRGAVNGGANYYFLKLDSSTSTDYSNALWIINSKLYIKGSIKDWKNLILTGSEPHDEFTELMKLYTSVRGKQNENEVLKKFVTDHPNSMYVSDLILKLATVYKPDGLVNEYKKLTNRAKNSYWGIKLGELVENFEKRKLKSGNGKIPNFYVTSNDGIKLSIHEIAARSKYTLIDFWASWCVPCRSAIPKLKKTYEKFHSKGFNIVGISIDKKHVDWKKALQEENMPWIQGLDNLENASQLLFSIQGVPSYILVDEQGKIIQSNIASATNDSQIIKFKNKYLGSDLYEIVERLLAAEESNNY